MALTEKKKKTDINNLRGFLVKLDVDGGVIGHTLNTMECIEVLMHGDLENGSSSLSMEMKQSSAIQIMTPTETCRLVITLYARKNDQTLNHRSPYLAITLSLLLIQFLYQR
jgi:hypothetical protein